MTINFVRHINHAMAAGFSISARARQCTWHGAPRCRLGGREARILNFFFFECQICWRVSRHRVGAVDERKVTKKNGVSIGESVPRFGSSLTLVWFVSHCRFVLEAGHRRGGAIFGNSAKPSESVTKKAQPQPTQTKFENAAAHVFTHFTTRAALRPTLI